MNDTTPEQIWQQTLEQLQLQMTKDTFDTWLKGTHVIEVRDGIWKIAVKNTFAKDWLENRLLDTVTRTLRNYASQDDITLVFVVSKSQHSADIRLRGDEPVDGQPHVLHVEEEDVAGITFAQETNFYVGKVEMGRWAAEFDYDRRFWSVYLGPAYNFWRYLIAHWASTLKKKEMPLLNLNKRNNQGWTSPFKLSYRAATEAMGKSNHAIVPGGIYECHRSLERRQMREFNVPLLAECCGAHECHDWRPQEEGGGRCFYWREGLVHKIHREHLLAMKILPTGRAIVQVLRVLPLLTPWQVENGLPDFLHDDHEKWVERYAEKYFNITPEQWAKTTLRRYSFYMHRDSLEIANYGQPPQNPFLSE